uniref:Uncharacterized protein n=1 Tax=Rhodosorus marinus TaxID=101924 RepID=A0A7S3EIZ1_9RHOD|mmetsp:Transcript_36348/g.145297  ORF Transcript_36348/g.145297 Transcript_36348/m.145297 type:complete len:585 (+) Transcript_36348:172-1926(+)
MMGEDKPAAVSSLDLKRGSNGVGGSSLSTDISDVGNAPMTPGDVEKNGSITMDASMKASNLTSKDMSELDATQEEKVKFDFKEFVKYTGPGWLAVVAYIDPGNLYADLTAGSAYAYSQLWVVFWATVVSWLALTICSKYGIYSRQHLARSFRESYPKWVNISMWVFIEIVVIATDVPEVIGFAYACNIFFGWPFYAGVLASFVTTMLFLMVLNLKRGFRVLEALVLLLVGIMCILLLVELFINGANVKQLFFGWAVPTVWSGSVFNMIGIIGAVVMPHNLFLLTGAVQTRIPRGRTETGKVFLYSKLEPIIPLCISWIVNLSVISLAAKNVFPETCPSGETSDPTGQCAAGPVINDPVLDPDSVTLLNFCQYFSSGNAGGCTIWGLALIAAAQASAMTTTFTGSFVMDGFIDMKIPVWTRSIATRCVAILPAVIIAAVVDTPESLDFVIGIVNVVLGLALPIALIPLIQLSFNQAKMGKYRISRILYWVSMAFNIFLVFFNAASFYTDSVFGQYMGADQASSNFVWAVQANILADVVTVVYITINFYFVFKQPTITTCAPLAEEDYKTEADTEPIDLGAIGAMT